MPFDYQTCFVSPNLKDAIYSNTSSSHPKGFFNVCKKAATHSIFPSPQNITLIFTGCVHFASLTLANKKKKKKDKLESALSLYSALESTCGPSCITVIWTYIVIYDKVLYTAWKISWKHWHLTQYKFYDSNSHDWNTRLLIHACILIITADQGMWSLIIGATSLILCLQKEIAKTSILILGNKISHACFYL